VLIVMGEEVKAWAVPNNRVVAAKAAAKIRTMVIFSWTAVLFVLVESCWQCFLWRSGMACGRRFFGILVADAGLAGSWITDRAPLPRRPRLGYGMNGTVIK
jgi:hypothetical protein